MIWDIFVPKDLSVPDKTNVAGRGGFVRLGRLSPNTFIWVIIQVVIVVIVVVIVAVVVAVIATVVIAAAIVCF